MIDLPFSCFDLNVWRMFFRPCLCADRRCRQIDYNAAERTENRENTIPVYQQVGTVHGRVFPFGKIVGHDPVLVRHPASSAPTMPTKLSSSSLWSLHRSVSSSRSDSVSAASIRAIESSVVRAGATRFMNGNFINTWIS